MSLIDFAFQMLSLSISILSPEGLQESLEWNRSLQGIGRKSLCIDVIIHLWKHVLNLVVQQDEYHELRRHIGLNCLDKWISVLVDLVCFFVVDLII